MWKNIFQLEKSMKNFVLLKNFWIGTEIIKKKFFNLKSLKKLDIRKNFSGRDR